MENTNSIRVRVRINKTELDRRVKEVERAHRELEQVIINLEAWDQYTIIKPKSERPWWKWWRP